MRKRGSSVNAFLCLVVLAINSSAVAQVIQISNVEELYSAVNNPGNAGTTLVLSAGNYMLSATDPNGTPRPKGGRVELQPDMSILGVEGDRHAVVIDAFNLPPTSFPQTANGIATGPNAAVRMGLGTNALEWLTVRGARFAQGNIDSGLQPLDPAPAYIRVAHVDSSGSTRGLNVLNFGPQTSGQTVEADIIDCNFFDNTSNISEGVRAGNFQGARGSIVNVRMSGNRSWGQKQGVLFVNNRAIESTVNVFSSGNRFYGNGGGAIIIGGLSSNNTRADGNVINFEAHGDQYVGNTGSSDFDRGGLTALAADNISSSSGGGSNNTVNIKLWGCRMLDNFGSDLTMIGARSVPASTAAFSQNNQVTIEIHGSGKQQGVEFFADSLPFDPSLGNWVTVIR
jgi:hypothetical protein